MSEEERVAHLPERWATSSIQGWDDCIPSVIPADAGIDVASPVSLCPGVHVWCIGVNGLQLPQE